MIPDVVLIDEAEAVVIDEARVPLVLAGAAESADADREMARIAAGLSPREHYEVDEDARNVSLTQAWGMVIAAAWFPDCLDIGQAL